jgi:hypothetical protein
MSEQKARIIHYGKGSETREEVFSYVAASALSENPLLVRLCYTCKNWFKLHEDFVSHVSSHHELPSIGLGEWGMDE